MTAILTASNPLLSRSTNFHHKRISWPAIFAGALVAVGIQLLLSLLGIGIGMGAMDPLHERNPAAGLGTATFVWWVATFLIALFIGGWVSGRLSRTMNKLESIMHGILTWVIFVILNMYLLTSVAGNIMSAAGGIAGSSISAASNMSVSPADSASIQAKIDQLKARTPEAEAKARDVADQVASSLSKAGIYGFIGLLLGAIIAGLSANMGRGNNYTDEQETEPGIHRTYVPAK